MAYEIKYSLLLVSARKLFSVVSNLVVPIFVMENTIKMCSHKSICVWAEFSNSNNISSPSMKFFVNKLKTNGIMLVLLIEMLPNMFGAYNQRNDL